MKEHFSSKAHKLCVKQEEYHACDAIMKSIDKMNERYIASTCRVFNTVYSLAKRCWPFSDIKDEKQKKQQKKQKKQKPNATFQNFRNAWATNFENR